MSLVDLHKCQTTQLISRGVSNHWTGMWNGTMEWNDGMEKEWNSEHTRLQLTRVTGTAQSKLNYLVYLQGCYLTAEAL